MTTATKPETARFFAPGEGLKLLYEHAEEEVRGNKLHVAKRPVFIEFESDGNGGQHFETDDPEMIAFLRGHEERERGQFSEIPKPKPHSGPVLAKIGVLAARGDVDALTALYVEEQDTYERADVLEAIKDTLEAFEGSS